jgi:hypothetical protein
MKPIVPTSKRAVTTFYYQYESNLKALSLLAGMLFLAFYSFSATIYANSSSGNDDTGDGSSENPYHTFHKAYTMASAGDIIHLQGTFTWTDANELGDVAKQVTY